MTNLVTRTQVEDTLDSHRLQVLGRGGRWYDIRRNGRTKTWVRQPGVAAIPVKLGYRECFYIHIMPNVLSHTDHISETLRVRPDNFNAKTRE